MLLLKIISKQYTCQKNFYWLLDFLHFAKLWFNQSPKMQDTIFLYDHLANKFYEITII